jgi:polyphenol oxidase
VDRDLTAELCGGSVCVVFTDRDDGNMSSVAGEGAQEGPDNRERLRDRLGLSGLARGYQVHGTRVMLAAEPTPAAAAKDELHRADGQATAVTGLGAMVLVADCLPVALAAPGAVAMLHAGWRGLAAGVLEEGVQTLRALTGERDIEAVLGPCAGPCCYEVGPEVRAALGRSGGSETTVDLAAIASERLRAAGVSDARRLGACTICDERFFSHRREGERAGRQAGVVWLS